MRLVIQRVKKAKVTVDQNTVGEIEKGLFILVGIKKGDTREQAKALVEKVSKLRIMSDVLGKMNLAIRELEGEILVVSQFTLYANTQDGNRPSFIDAEDPGLARELYDYFVEKLVELEISVATGSFGDYMHIETELDGPVTIILEN